MQNYAKSLLPQQSLLHKRNLTQQIQGGLTCSVTPVLILWTGATEWMKQASFHVPILDYKQTTVHQKSRRNCSVSFSLSSLYPGTPSTPLAVLSVLGAAH